MDQANAAMTADSRFSYHPLKTCEQTGASHTRSCIVLKDTQQMLSLSKQSSKAPGDTSLQDATSLTILGGAAQSSTRLLDHLGAFPPMLARTLPALATLCVVNAELTSSSLRPNNMRYLWHYSSLSELVFQKVCFATASQLLDMMSVVPSLSILRTQAVTASTTRGLSQERQLPGNIAGLRRIVVEDHHDDPVVNLITKVGNEATLSVLEVGVGGTVGDGKLWAPLVCLTSASLEEFCLRCVPGEMEPTVLQDVVESANLKHHSRLRRLTLTSWHSPGADHSWIDEVLSTVKSDVLCAVTVKLGFAVRGYSAEPVHSLFDELRHSGLLKHIERVLSEIKSFAKLPDGSVCLVIDPTYYGSPNQEPVRIEMGDDVHIRWDELVRGEMAQANARGVLSTKILREAS